MDQETDLKSLVSTAVTGLTITVAFLLLALNISHFWVVFIIGFGGLLPFSVVAVEYYEDNILNKDKQTEKNQHEQKEGALEELKTKFVNGEISEEEFEERVEKLVQTEDLENAEEYIERAKDETKLERELN